MKIKHLFFFLVILFFNESIGQEKTQEIQQTIYYSFSNITSQDQVSNLEKEISLLDNVNKVKSEFKLEKGIGQVIVLVTDKITLSDNSEQAYFDVRSIKNLILKNDLSPLQVKQEKITKK